VLVTDKTGLDNAIARIGFPLVAKIQSRDIPHKSEVGGVRVNIATKGEVFMAYEALLESARRHRPDAAIQGVLVGPMAKKGVEIIIGTMLDATFGPMIMVGLGGITTELFRDVIYRPAPVSADRSSRPSNHRPTARPTAPRTSTMMNAVNPPNAPANPNARPTNRLTTVAFMRSLLSDCHPVLSPGARSAPGSSRSSTVTDTGIAPPNGSTAARTWPAISASAAGQTPVTCTAITSSLARTPVTRTPGK